ncbi:MAG: AAA family ATPase [Anaerolineae bacterium]|nr:AAA family ATPase [Anaerolineae bacterium]
MDFFAFSSYAHTLSELRALWDIVRDTHTLQIAVVAGESGSNKTGLIEEFLRLHRARCVRSRGVGIPGSYLPLQLAYESILQLDEVQTRLRQPWEAAPPEWQTFLNTLYQVKPMLHLASNPVWELSMTALGAETEAAPKRERTASASLPEHFATTLGELARLAPLVLFVDDIDQVDGYTRDALARNIIPQLRETPVLCIFTLADAGPLEEFLSHLPRHDTFRLLPLQRDEIKYLVSKQFPELLTSGLAMVVEHIKKVTGGSLAPVLDIIQWITKQNESVILAHPDAISDNAALLKAQFETLRPSEQAILQVAACQGRYFFAAAIAEALDKPRQEIMQTLNRLADILGWIRFDTRISSQGRVLTWYGFQARVYHETVYQSIPDDRRAACHRQIAYALERLYSEDTPAVVDQLAWQFEQGEVPAKAAAYQAEMAHQANNQGNMDQALIYAQKGLDHLDPIAAILPDSTALACRLLIEQGRALQGTERSHLAIDILQEAHALAEYLEDGALQTQASLYLGMALLNRNRLEESTAYLSAALEQAARQRDWELVIEAIDSLRIQYGRRGQGQRFLSLCSRVAALLQEEESAGARVALAEMLANQGWLHYQQSEHEAALAAIAQALEHLDGLERREHYPGVHYKLHRLKAIIACVNDDPAQALEQAEAALRWADASRLRRNQASAQTTKAAALHALGRIAEAAQEYETAIALLKHTSDLDTLALLEQSYGRFLADTGRPLIARQFFQRAYEHASTVSNLYRAQVALSSRAAVDKLLGYFKEARADYKQLLNQGIGQEDKMRQSISLNQLGDLYRLFNRTGEAKHAHRQAARLSDELSQQAQKALSLDYLGRAHLAAWELQPAGAAFDEAAALYAAGVAPAPARHRSAIFRARLALCRGDRTGATALLQRAIAGLERVQDLQFAGIGHLNHGLLLLLSGDVAGALAAAQRASEHLNTVGGWRVADACHLLARCHLAQGAFKEANNEIKRAYRKFMGLDLFHRVHQVESTGLQIEQAREVNDIQPWTQLDSNELRFIFNHLGI